MDHTIAKNLRYVAFYLRSASTKERNQYPKNLAVSYRCFCGCTSASQTMHALVSNFLCSVLFLMQARVERRAQFQMTLLNSILSR